MKILMVCNIFPPSIGGIQKSNYEIAKGINLKINDLTVVVINAGVEERGFDSKQNFNIIRTGPGSISWQASLLNLPLMTTSILFSAPKIIETIKEFNPDKIIFADYATRLLLGLVPVEKITDAEIITITSVPKTGDMVGSQFLGRLRGAVLKRCYKKSDKVAFVSKSTENELRRYYGNEIFDKKETDIIYRNVDDKFSKESVDKDKLRDLKEKYDIDDNKKVVLSVSRIKKKKGIDKTLEALKMYRDESNDDFHYIIVGDGDYLPKIKEIIKELELEEHVTTTGYVDFDDVIHYYDLCDIFILPSRRKISESFGRVFAEASARKKPVIGGKVGGVKEVIDDGVTGYLVNPRNIDEIYRKIKKLLEDKELRTQMGKKGREKVENTFTFEILKERLENVLNE